MTRDDPLIDEARVSSTPTRTAWMRTFYWLVRRELWEHRALVVAPAAVAIFAVLMIFLWSLVSPAAVRAGGPAASPYAAATGMIIIAGLIVGILYSLDALKSERRDRSILFWKSLPVSDQLTVLSKAAIPIVLLPLFLVALALAAHLVLVLLQSLAWQVRGHDARLLWRALDLRMLWTGLFYGAPFMMLWNAPLYAWLLMVSAWARRVAFLWAIAPVAAILAIEHTVLHRTGAHWMVERRIAGGILEPYTVPQPPGHANAFVWVERLDQFDPLRLYTLPGLWIGVILAAAMLYAAARLRRSRAPV